MNTVAFFKLEACTNWGQFALTWAAPPSLVLPGNLSPWLDTVDTCLWVYDSSCCIAGFLLSEVCSCPTAWVQRLLVSENFGLLISRLEVGNFSQFMLQSVVQHDAVRQILNIPNSSCQIQSGRAEVLARNWKWPIHVWVASSKGDLTFGCGKSGTIIPLCLSFFVNLVALSALNRCLDVTFCNSCLRRHFRPDGAVRLG